MKTDISGFPRNNTLRSGMFVPYTVSPHGIFTNYFVSIKLRLNNRIHDPLKSSRGSPQVHEKCNAMCIWIICSIRAARIQRRKKKEKMDLKHNPERSHFFLCVCVHTLSWSQGRRELCSRSVQTQTRAICKLGSPPTPTLAHIYTHTHTSISTHT